MKYLYSKKVELILQSNSIIELGKISNEYFSKKISKRKNNPEDKDNYVSINRISYPTKVNKR